VKIWGITNTGLARSQNQDCYTFGSDAAGDKLFALICDGMGGAAAGDVASKTALAAFASNMTKDEKLDFTARTMESRMVAASGLANRAVFDAAIGNPDYEGMGTTLVCALCAGNQAVVGNVGDSRAYLIDDKGIRQITRDHSLVGEMMERGELSAYQAQRHPSRNVVTRVLGVEPEVCCDTFKLQLKPGQFLLLCSDGLSNEVSEPEINYEVYSSGKPENACKSLVDIANNRGGHDNITVILIQF